MSKYAILFFFLFIVLCMNIIGEKFGMRIILYQETEKLINY